MNLEKLFEMQKELDEDILNHHPELKGEDLLPKKILALQVELAECAQCWRGFKFWSNDQEPRRSSVGTKLRKKNPLLEEYVDGLHFYLSIGNEIGVKNYKAIESVGSRSKDVSVIFALLNKRVADMWWNWHDNQESDFQTNWLFGFGAYVWLAELLGFTWEEVERAYDAKNATNHTRQETGY